MIAATTIWSLFDPVAFLAGVVAALVMVVIHNVWHS
jgi:hypothetical protein